MRVDDHHVNAVVLGKAIDLGELLGVIDEVLHPFAILSGKVFRHTFKTLEHTLANGNTGYHDNELTPAVALVQFIHCLLYTSPSPRDTR
mgnify:CR=1 FL=1